MIPEHYFLAFNFRLKPFQAIPHQEPEKMESNDSFPDSANLAKIQMQKSKIRK